MATTVSTPTALVEQESTSAIMRSLSGTRKAAILLTSVGDEVSANLLRQLSEEQVHDVTREISLLNVVPDQERTAVLREFLKIAERPAAFQPGGIEYATSVLMSAFGPETGKRMVERLLKSIGNDTPSIDSLRRADPQHLAKVLHREHPQTIALILCHLGTLNAARLLSALPEKLRSQVARRMAALDQISPEVTNDLAKIICAKLRILGESSLESCGGVRAVAELLNRVDSDTSDVILEEIGSEDPGLAQTIQQLMFVFEDLMNISQDALRKLLARVDKKVLTLALKGTTPQVKKHFMGLMSSRAAEMLTEDMAALGPVRIREVQEAQQAMIATARQLQEVGEISLAPAATEQFVE